MTEQQEKILAVLDMSYDEQWEWLEKKYGGGAFHSFETLAWTLRNKAVTKNHADFHEAIYDVMMKVEGCEKWATAFWGECIAKPIHWIIAALLAKESK